MLATGKISFLPAVSLLVFILVAISASCLTAANEEPARPVLDKLNVFAVVSKNIEASFFEAAKTLMEEEAIESFPLKGYQTHCTLYMTQYPEGLQQQITDKLAEIASNTREFPVQTTGLEVTSGNWFFMNLDRNRNLQTLSDTVVASLSELRAPSDFVPDWAKNMPTKVEYITKYGSPNVYSEFNPHLTLLASSDEEKLQRFLQKHANDTFGQAISGKVVAIGVGVADRDGQIKEPLKIFPLQPEK